MNSQFVRIRIWDQTEHRRYFERENFNSIHNQIEQRVIIQIREKICDSIDKSVKLQLLYMLNL